jgi:hypothetical protein
MKWGWKWGATILVAAAFGAVPVAAQSAPPVLPPSMQVQAVQVYALHGTLSRYVPATKYVTGSITVKVDAATATGRFAVGSTITFRVTSATIVQTTAGAFDKKTTGWVRIYGAAGINSVGTLQALPAMFVSVDRLETQPVITI